MTQVSSEPGLSKCLVVNQSRCSGRVCSDLRDARLITGRSCDVLSFKRHPAFSTPKLTGLPAGGAWRVLPFSGEHMQRLLSWKESRLQKQVD